MLKIFLPAFFIFAALTLPLVLTPDFWQDPLEVKISQMTIEEKIGQMFMLGIFTDDLEFWKKEFLQERNIGGVILHPYNVEKNEEQLAGFVADLQEGNDLPLLIAVNQEGGDENILGGEIATIKFAKEKRGGRIIANEETAFEIGLKRAKELKELGVNVNFAPVVDVVEQENSFLYSRSFSGNPEKVASLAVSYIKGQKEGGVISGVKHFPGHGISLGDSHINIPISFAKKEDLEKHLLPFRAAVKEGAEMIMATHLLFPNIDKENPVPFSPVFLKDILRDELGFGGIIITDDIEMKAVRPFYSVAEAALAAAKAGADVIVISGIEEVQKKSYAAMLEAVKSGEISEERINQSLRRILKVKYNLTNI